MADSNSPDVGGGRKLDLTRRDFLNLTGKVLGGVALAKIIHVTGLVFNQEPIRSVIWGPDYDEIPYAIPPEFEEVKIPEINEHQLPASQIVMNGLKIYEGWCTQDNTLKPITYTPPENYLDQIDVGMTVSTHLATALVKGQALEFPMHNAQIEVLHSYNLDMPYSNFINFGKFPIAGLRGLIKLDAGSGIVAKTRQRYAEKFGKDKNLFDQAFHSFPNFTPEEEGFLLQNITSQLTDAKNWIDKARHGSRISTGILLPYFLFRNEGKLLPSLVDITLYLKIMARNNNEKLDFSPERSGALVLGDQFTDESSAAIPYDWLIDHTRKLPGTNHLWDASASGKFVDFMPIGRDGGYYHDWNINLWAACMSPLLVSTLVKAYYSDSTVVYHGRVKIEAAVRNASEAPILDQIYRKYITSK